MADARRAPLKDRTDISGARALIVEARFYDDIQDALLEGAVAELKAAGMTHDVITVPGSLEIPAAIAIAMVATATAARAGIMAAEAPNGSSRRRNSIDRRSGKAAGFRRLFGFRARRRRPGNNPPACWTSPDRFAKRRPLEKAFPGRLRAHSSVGRADDS